jgi:S-adenosylmethionine hydrolase
MDLPRNTVTLTTDFGTRDYFAGAMKGVILGINPVVKLVDISHEVPSHDVWGAAYLIGASYKFFPNRTIHMVIVDPGVGSARRPILAITDKHYFLAPDNGVLSFVYADPGFSRVVHITADHYFLPSVGSTFHARDIFAPCAAWLSKGVESEKFGDEITDYVRFNIPVPKKESENVLAGEVVYADKFGNSISNISFSDIEGFAESSGLKSHKIQLKDMVIENISPFYASAKRGEPGVVVNGNGFIEVFVNQGDARRTLGIKRGDSVKVVFG